MMRVLPFRGAHTALRAAATRVVPRAAVAAFPCTTFPVKLPCPSHGYIFGRAGVAAGLRAFSRQSDDDNHANQCNPNNDEYWDSRDMDNPADDEPDNDDDHDYDNDNHANQMNPYNDEYAGK
ncbi:hypothetical protein T484DRAFT_2019696 [Baffinella frigidus]|nr:hypothetical protein T484DRAFT_2019696 [Cryptophyta sp. CCMP2293]